MNTKRLSLLLVISMLAVLSSDAAELNISKSGALTETEISRIQAEPGVLLKRFLEGGPKLADYVSRAVITDVSLADPIFSITADATPQQASAIGAGFARAARALGGKQPKVALAISEKVRRVESTRLKITFYAIGPSYAVNFAPKLPDLIPYAELTSPEIGLSLSGGKSRLGIPRETVLAYGVDFGSEGNIAATANGHDILGQDTMFVAILSSDAPKNGAVSTSPTR